jgi:hypothetical protein
MSEATRGARPFLASASATPPVPVHTSSAHLLAPLALHVIARGTRAGVATAGVDRFATLLASVTCDALRGAVEATAKDTQIPMWVLAQSEVSVLALDAELARVRTILHCVESLALASEALHPIAVAGTAADEVRAGLAKAAKAVRAAVAALAPVVVAAAKPPTWAAGRSALRPAVAALVWADWRLRADGCAAPLLAAAAEADDALHEALPHALAALPALAPFFAVRAPRALADVVWPHVRAPWARAPGLKPLAPGATREHDGASLREFADATAGHLVGSYWEAPVHQILKVTWAM